MKDKIKYILPPVIFMIANIVCFLLYYNGMERYTIFILSFLAFCTSIYIIIAMNLKMSIISTIIIDLEMLLIVLLTAIIESPGTSTLFYGLVYYVSIICITPIIFNTIMILSILFRVIVKSIKKNKDIKDGN